MHKSGDFTDTNFIMEKGSETLSKQSNQRYRKEKEKEAINREGKQTSSTSSTNDWQDNKSSREVKDSSKKTNTNYE